MTDQPIAALYLRSATHDDDAIADQHRRCEDHAAARGWRVGDVFVDNGASGTQDRPGLVALRTCIAAGRARIALVIDQVRIARDPAILSDLNRFFETRGARFAYVDTPSDFPSEISRFFPEGRDSARETNDSEASP